ncbi:MAG: hypothetical protein KKF44_00920, partial [Nanoarchaeota archaeon]|nr:hypothetical protein [Nanoarchaeota archaeon]
SSYENPFTYTFDIADDYAVGTVNMTMIGPGGSITPSSILCTGVDTSKTCQVYLSRTEGTHNVSFTVLDSVGNTHYENSTFILDTTVSSLAEINDSGDITSSKTLTATWSPYIDNVSSLDHYEYAIGVVPYPLTGYDSVLAWTNTGSNTVNSGPHNLIHGTVYYISARAQNNVGLYTNVVTTDGIVYADNTPPLIPGIWDEGVFTSTDEGIFVWWNATDDESGVAAYELAVGTAAYPYEGWYNMAAYAFPSTTNSQFFTLALEQNETYYVTVRAQNGYGAWSQRNSSDGITVDITAPAEGNINYSAGTYETNSVSLFFDEGRDNESGIMESSLWYARLLYRDNTCSGNYVFDNYIGDVTGTYDYNYTMENGYCYKFMLRVYNNANLSSEYYYYRDLLNKSIFVDTTPPVTFNVTDDGAITYDGTKLHAEWTSSSDAESGLDHYEYRVQYTFNNGPRIGLVNWTDVGLATEITDYFRLNHTNLTHQYKYYYDVRAFNSISMNTTESSDGIIYIDIYKPETTLVSVGRDFDAPYSDENFGNISINVSGEIDMKCVYSVNDIDYSDSADECTTYGTMASCLIENLQTGNYTYHIICSDINGNGQDFDENIDVSFSAFVYEPIVHSVIVNSTDVLRITYKNASDYLFGTGYSDSVINTTLFENYVYKMIIENPGGKFIVRMDDVNVSENQVFNISAKEINISQIASNVTGIGADERYIPRYAYAMEIGSNYSGNYFIRFNYTNISVSNENALMIYRLAYDFNNDSIDYNVSTLYSGASRDTSSNFVSVTVENFSVYVLVEDRDMPETCGDLIDNDGNGLVDDGCPTPKTSPGGSSDKEVVARRSGGGGYSVPRFEDCDDDRMNQDETGVDCGGICAEEPYSRKCVAGQGCLENNDCETEACNLEIGLCYQPTCTDRLLNQGEEDVDCGGPCDECYDNTEDFDKDGIPNVWEEKYSVMDPRDASDARKDPDNDGLENIFEYKYGTDPSKPDTDGDGFSDNEEILIKTDPLDRNSVPPNCDDKIKNNGEEDVDCGGPCNTCVVVEEPAPSVLVPLMFGFIIIGAIVAGLIFRQRQKVIVREKTKAEPVAETLSDTTLLGKQSIPAKPIPVIPIRKKIDVSDAMLLKLQNYVNYKVMQEESLETVRKELESLKWPEYIIDQVLRNTGDIRYMKKLYELDDYINTDLKGFSHAEIRKRLKLSKWDDADIDLVISKAFNLSDFQALDNFVMLQLAKGTDKNDIETLLEQAGWPRKILDRIMLQHISLLKKDQEEIEEKILFFFQKGYTEKQVTSRMLNMGFNEDIVNLIIFSKYSVEKNVDILRNYVNMRLIKGDTIESIRKTIINAHWGIDVIDMIIHENFRATDMKYLIALDKYIKDAFVKGYTKDIITNDLLVQKWADEYIDLVMLEVHIIDDKVDNVKKFINLRLEKGDARNKITELLVKIGWGRKVVEDVFENRK